LFYSDKFSEGDLLRILSFIGKTSYEIKTSSNQKLKLEVALVHLIGLERTSTISELLNKIDKADFKSITVSNFSSSSSSAEVSTKIVTAPIKNIEPIPQGELKIPQVESFILPKVENDSDLTNVIEQWKNFVEQVKNEKVFFGSVLFNSNPVNFTNDQIQLEVDHPEDEDIIKNNESYLDSKTKEVFGKRIRLNVSKKRSVSKKHSLSQNSEINQEENPIAQIIIKDLGGREIHKR
jgi:DNA polymerase-3 subunit gamma/tau